MKGNRQLRCKVQEEKVKWPILDYFGLVYVGEEAKATLLKKRGSQEKAKRIARN